MIADATHDSSLLLTLAEISNLVAHSHEAAETLGNIVQLIQARFATDVCSVYVLEQDRTELVLGATVGLKPDSVGHVRMHVHEGLTGLVAERLEPVTVADAFQHPRFKYFPEAGEDRYHSFLGVPLFETGTLHGVLVVQTIEPREFSSSEIRMLVTVAAQLAPLVSGARFLERVVAAAQVVPARASLVARADAPVELDGIPLSPGWGAGLAYVVKGFEREFTVVESALAPDAERQRLETALEAAREDLGRVSGRISELVGDDHGAILQAQQLLLQDRTVLHDLNVCLETGLAAEAAVLETLHKYVAVFDKLKDPYFRERQYDIKDVFRRVLWHLRPRPITHDSIGERIVLVAQEASVADLFSVERERLAAVIVQRGGPQSHAAILARSLGVPMVSCTSESVQELEAGRRLFVDGSAGIVYLDLAPENYRLRKSRGVAPQEVGPASLTPSAPLPSAIPSAAGPADDNRSRRPLVEANINLLSEAPQAIRAGAAGVGLYRTEFLFLARRTLPTEEEQVGIYQKLLKVLDGRPASIRTFDLRPDKLTPGAQFGATSRSLLDWRLVLESPIIQQLFKDQVRAILRAATHGPARILIPLVTRTEQLDFVLKTLDVARDELRRQGLEYRADVPLGAMIEVAAVTPLIPQWAKRVDFFALGTNDLLASSLGVNRDDPVGVSSDDWLHPGWLRLIHSIVTEILKSERRLTVCGEMAADPRGALVLTAFGVNSMSVAVHQIEATTQILHAARTEILADLAAKLTSGYTIAETKALFEHADRAA